LCSYWRKCHLLLNPSCHNHSSSTLQHELRLYHHIHEFPNRGSIHRTPSTFRIDHKKYLLIPYWDKTIHQHHRIRLPNANSIILLHGSHQDSRTSSYPCKSLSSHKLYDTIPPRLWSFLIALIWAGWFFAFAESRTGAKPHTYILAALNMWIYTLIAENQGGWHQCVKGLFKLFKLFMNNSWIIWIKYE
jgi:hypothetical protein